MIWVSAWVMTLAASRDRMALAMTFVLPAILFVVFAAIFSGATGKDLKLKIGLLDLAHSPSTARFAAALRAEKTVRVVAYEGETAAPLVDGVARGAVDVGIALRGDLARRPEAGPPPILVVEDAARPLAGTIAMGQTQRTLNEKLPDVALSRILADVEASGAIDAEERDVLDEAFQKQAQEKAGTGFSFARVAEIDTVNAIGGNANVLYYAGSVISIFLLFSAAHGGLTVLEERESGVAERLRLTRGGFAATLAGKFLFLCGQGVVQAVIVYLVAYLAFGATISPDRLWILALTSLFASAAAAGLGLGMVSACRTRKQAENATTFLVLLVSAVGGSMVPRYLMPPWLQAIGLRDAERLVDRRLRTIRSRRLESAQLDRTLGGASRLRGGGPCGCNPFLSPARPSLSRLGSPLGPAQADADAPALGPDLERRRVKTRAPDETGAVAETERLQRNAKFATTQRPGPLDILKRRHGITARRHVGERDGHGRCGRRGAHRALATLQIEARITKSDFYIARTRRYVSNQDIHVGGARRSARNNKCCNQPENDFSHT